MSGSLTRAADRDANSQMSKTVAHEVHTGRLEVMESIFLRVSEAKPIFISSDCPTAQRGKLLALVQPVLERYRHRKQDRSKLAALVLALDLCPLKRVSI